MTSNYSSKDLSFFQLYSRFINDSNRGRRLQPNGKRISAGTVKNYESTLQLIQRFCSSKNFLLRIRPARKLNSRELQAEKNYWKKFISGLRIICMTVAVSMIIMQVCILRT